MFDPNVNLGHDRSFDPDSDLPLESEYLRHTDVLHNVTYDSARFFTSATLHTNSQYCET